MAPSTLLSFDIDGPAEAPPLLLLHPIATSARIWGPQWPVWCSHWRVVRMDLPGHGRTPLNGPFDLRGLAAQVAATLDEIKLDRVAVLGLSWGGMVAQALALHHPDRVAALVLAHTTARTDANVRALWAQRISQAREHGMAAQVGPTMARWFTRGFLDESPLTCEWVAAQIRATPLEGYAAAAASIQQLDHIEALTAVTAPTMVLSGEFDTAAPPGVGEQIAQAMPNARHMVLSGCAHLGNVEQPVRFAEAVGTFLTGVGH